MPEERIKSPAQSPSRSADEGAAFALVIATQRDPAAEGDFGQDPIIVAPEQTAVVDASGTFSREGAIALAQEIDELFSGGCTSCIVRLRRVQAVDHDALLIFAAWVRGRLDEGRDVRISADQPEVWDLLAGVADLQGVLQPIADTSVEGHRRRVESRHPDPS